MSIAKGPIAESSPSVIALRRKRVSMRQKIRAALHGARHRSGQWEIAARAWEQTAFKLGF